MATSDQDSGPAVVLLHVWGVPRRGIPGALARMATGPRRLRAVPGLHFAKALGTSSGETFSPRQTDPRHWALLTTWASTEAADEFARHPVVHAWNDAAEERLDVRLAPLASRGRWSQHLPFGDPVPVRHDGPVASITRARVKLGKMASFWRAVPPVAVDVNRTPGLRIAMGIGESPIGLQGTFSLWDSAGSLLDFATRGTPHQEVVRRTATEGWYAEELFARFAVLGVSGTYRGIEP